MLPLRYQSPGIEVPAFILVNLTKPDRESVHGERSQDGCCPENVGCGMWDGGSGTRRVGCGMWDGGSGTWGVGCGMWDVGRTLRLLTDGLCMGCVGGTTHSISFCNSRTKSRRYSSSCRGSHSHDGSVRPVSHQFPGQCSCTKPRFEASDRSLPAHRQRQRAY
jgi:hypothetical protein